jgi:hypothetical protein
MQELAIGRWRCDFQGLLIENDCYTATSASLSSGEDGVSHPSIESLYLCCWRPWASPYQPSALVSGAGSAREAAIEVFTWFCNTWKSFFFSRFFFALDPIPALSRPFKGARERLNENTRSTGTLASYDTRSYHDQNISRLV